jgi:hypothetical protein
MSFPVLGQRGKKLYFDVQFTATRRSQTFACTPFRTGLPGDRFGAFLSPLEACTGSSPGGVAQSREVGAWFQPSSLPASTALGFDVMFVAPTVGNNIAVSGLPFLTAGGAGVSAKLGQSAIFGTAGQLRQFSVFVAKQRVVTAAATGVLYVQRQHGIEV